MKEKGLSRGELESVVRAAGGLEALLDENCRDQDALALIKYISDRDKMEKLLENQQVLKLPIVRNGRQATAGCHPEIWKTWE